MLRSSVGRRLLRATILFSTAVTLVITLFQLSLDYSAQKNRVDEEFQMIQRLFGEPIKVSMWNFYGDLLTSQLQSILQMDSVAIVSLEAKEQKTYRMSNPVRANGPVMSHPLIFKTQNGEVNLGTLKVQFTLDRILSDLYLHGLIIWGSNMVKAFLVSTFILYFFSLRVSLPLLTIARRALELSATQSMILEKDTPSVLSPDAVGPVDEVQALKESLEIMHRNFDQSIRSLKQSEGRLRDLVNFGSDYVFETSASLELQYVQSSHKDPSDPLADLMKPSRSLLHLPFDQPTRDVLLSRGAIRDGTFEISQKKSQFLTHYRYTIKSTFNDENQFIGFRGILTNITQAVLASQKILSHQEQIRQIQKMEEELRRTNTQLEERAQLLEQQRNLIQQKNLELDKTARELLRKTRELEQANAFKSSFLANMSHELRTPLNSLLILSESLRENKTGNLTSKQVEFASIIHSGGSDLLALINDILDLSKIEAGKLDYLLEEVRLADLVDQLNRTFKPLADTKRVKFEVFVEPGVPDILTLDPKRTQQILKNLLSNAVKFTEKGSVALRVYSPADDENPLSVPAIAFEAKDTGPGIPADKHEMIFQAFQQADSSVSRKYGGTGLGLSISKQLAQGLGGRIQLESEPGFGSRFTLFLPLSEALNESVNEAVSQTSHSSFRDSAKITETHQDFSISDFEEQPRKVVPNTPIVHAFDEKLLQGKKVMLVDDDVRNVYSLGSVLNDYGFEVTEATHGTMALELLDKNPSMDVVIMDIMMPEMDGYETIRRIRADARFKRLPIVALTAKAMAGDREDCLRAGANGYVSKPADVQELLQALVDAMSELKKLG